MQPLFDYRFLATRIHKLEHCSGIAVLHKLNQEGYLA